MAKEKRVPKFMELLTIEEIADLYKHFSGVTQVKFKDRQAAEERLLAVAAGKLRPTMMEAMRQVGIHQDTINQYNQYLRGPILAPEGWGMTAEQMKKHKAALAADRKNGSSSKAPKAEREVRLRDADAAVLLAIREVQDTIEKGEVNSTKIAELLNTNINALCKSLEKLSKLGLIEIEDDSNDEHPMFWVKSLTDAGKEMVVPTPQKKLPAANPGPRSSFSNKVIHKLVSTNPRREGTWGWKGWALYKDGGVSYEDFRKAGGRNNDLQWDLDKGYVALLAPGEAAPAMKKGAATPAAAEKEKKAAASAPTPAAAPVKPEKAKAAPGPKAQKKKKAKAAPKKKAKAAKKGGH